VINGEQATKMPGKGEKIKFINHNRQLPFTSYQVPFVIYADFEAITKKLILVNQMIVNPILKLIKNILIVDLVTKSYAVMMISIPNRLRFTEVKMRFTNSWKK